MSSTYPPLEELLEKRRNIKPGSLLFDTRMSYFAVFSSIFWLVIAVMIYLAIAFNYPDLKIGGISVSWFLLIPLGMFLEILRRRYDNLYLFHTDKVIQQGGRLSLRSNRPIMNYQHIVMVAIDQDIMGRMFDYGDVELSSAAEDISELVIQGVRHPRELADIIEGIMADMVKDLHIA